MKYENMPAIISLIAGLIVCIVTFIYKYDGISFLSILIGVLVLFYIIGLCLRALFNVVLKDPVEEDESPEDEENKEDNTDDTNEQK